MEWTRERILEFINRYESEPILWNPRAESHKNMHLVFKAWIRIHRGLGWECKIHDLKKKRDSLMAAYRTFINRKKKAVAAGTEPEKITWFAFDALDNFLGPIYEKKTVHKQINDEESTTEEIENWSARRTKRPRHDLRSTEMNITRPQTSQTQEVNQYQNFCNNDEYEIFGKLITNKIRKIQSIEIKETLMNDIHSIVCKACIEDTQKNPLTFVYTNNDEQICEFSSDHTKFTPSTDQE